MFRIDNTSAVGTLPIAPPPALPGFFTDGDPALAIPSTIVDACWANQIQEEILTVIEAAGLVPNKSSHRQLFDALTTLYLGAGTIGNYLPLAGGAMTGFITLHAYPEMAMHATPKGYVDALFAGVPPDMAGLYLPISGGTLANPGNLTVSGGFVVTGGAELHGTLGVYGGLTALAFLNVTDYVSVGTSLTVIGAASIGTTLSVGTTLQVVGAAEVRGALAVYGGLTAYTFLNITDYVSVGTSLTVTGAASIGASLSVGTTLQVAGAAEVHGTLSVYQTLFADGGINAGTLQVAGGAEIHGTLSVYQTLFADGGIYTGRVQGTGTGGIEPNTFDIYGTQVIYPTNGNLAYGFYVEGSGKIRQDLYLDYGHGYQPGGGSWGDQSDLRLKRDVARYERGLDAIRALRPVTYKFNGLGSTPDDDTTYHGLVAQEVLDIMPEMVSQKPVKFRAEDKEDTPVYFMNCTALTFALVNCVQELVVRLENLEAKG